MGNYETALLARVISGELEPGYLQHWDGAIEVAKCVLTPDGPIRTDDDEEATWLAAPYWSVFAHQSEGGTACIADVHTEAEAEAFAAGLLAARAFYEGRASM
jgi:hypothetical protein